MDTLERLRNPATVVPANGEVQTNKGTQVYVYDLDLFAAVKNVRHRILVLSMPPSSEALVLWGCFAKSALWRAGERWKAKGRWFCFGGGHDQSYTLRCTI